jgi:hypothetical protein
MIPPQLEVIPASPARCDRSTACSHQVAAAQAAKAATLAAGSEAGVRKSAAGDFANQD